MASIRFKEENQVPILCLAGFTGAFLCAWIGRLRAAAIFMVLAALTLSMRLWATGVPYWECLLFSGFVGGMFGVAIILLRRTGSIRAPSKGASKAHTSGRSTGDDQGLDIPSQIGKLGELKVHGLLSEEEFQAKKTELLSRM
jgi:hypothetical protein